MDHKSSEQTDAIRWVRRIVALAGIIFISIGEYLIIAQPVDDNKVVPAYFWLFIPGICLLILSLFIRPSLAIQARLMRLRNAETAFGVLLSFLLSGLTTLSLILFHTQGTTTYIPVTITWFASGIVFILAFRDKPLPSFNPLNWFDEYRSEILLVGLAIVLASSLRFYELGNLPKVVDGDEGLIGIYAQSTESGELANPFSLWENFGSLYLQAVNFLFEVFGVSPLTLRLLPAISGVLAIPAVYMFTRQISGVRIATIAAFLLAVSHAHIHFSRIASVGYIHSTWLVPLELYLLLSGLEKRSSVRTAASGVLLAMHLRVYLTSHIIFGLVLVYMLIARLLLKDWFKAALKQAIAFWGGFIVVLLPQLYYILNNPNEFFNRLKTDGTFQSGWLVSTMANTGQTAGEILVGRVFHAFLSLIYYPAIDFYGSTSPLLSVFSAIFFLIGLGIALARTKSPGYLILNGYFWVAPIAVGIFSLPPNADSYRMLIALPPAFVMAAIGVDYLLSIYGIEWEKSRITYIYSAASILIAMSILGIWMYYFDFAGKCRYGGNLEARFASYLGVYAKTVEEDSAIYLLSDNIYFYGSHASADFLSEHREITNYPDPMGSYQVKYDETIIASPNRIEELLTWVGSNPGGIITTLYDCDRTILVSYKIPEKTFGP